MCGEILQISGGDDGESERLLQSNLELAVRDSDQVGDDDNEFDVDDNGGGVGGSSDDDAELERLTPIKLGVVRDSDNDGIDIHFRLGSEGREGISVLCTIRS